MSTDSELSLALGDKKALFYARPLSYCLCLTSMMRAEIAELEDSAYVDTCNKEINDALLHIWRISVVSQSELWLNILHLSEGVGHYIERTIFVKLLCIALNDIARSEKMINTGKKEKSGSSISWNEIPAWQQSSATSGAAAVMQQQQQEEEWCSELYQAIDRSEGFEGCFVSQVLINVMMALFQDYL